MRIRLLPLLLLALAACRSGPVDPVVRGKSNFTLAGCVKCHVVGGHEASTGPNLAWIGFSHSSEWLDEFLKDPAAWKKAMPNPNLPDHVRASLVAYLDTLEGSAYPEGAAPWDAVEGPAAKGRSIFHTVGCKGCHGTEGVGGIPNPGASGGLVPSLAGLEERYSRAELKDRIRKGSTVPGGKLSMPAWGTKLDEGELDALAAYLLALKGPTSEDW